MLSKIQALKNNAGFRKYASNTSWVMGEKILRMFVGLFVGIWVARYLGPDQFGLLSYAQSFVFLFVALSTLGLDGIVVRELVNDSDRRDVLVGTAFGLKLMGALTILPVLWIAVQIVGNDSFTNLLIFIVASATIFQSFNAIDFFFQAKVLSKYVAAANTISLGFSSLIKIALLLMEAPLIAFAIVILFDSVILAVGLIYYYSKPLGRKLSKWRFDLSLAKSLLKDSWPLILSGLVVSIYMRIDQVMLNHMIGSEATGIYSAASRLSEVWYFLPIVLANSLFPAILNAKKKSERLYIQRIQNLFSLMVCIALPGSAFVFFFSDSIVSALYGKEYIDSAPVLKILILSGVFVFWGVSSGKWFIAENLTRLAFYRTALGAVLNIILNAFWIPRYGVTGAAFALLVSQAFAAYFFDLMNRQTRQIFLMKTKSLYLRFHL